MMMKEKQLPHPYKGKTKVGVVGLGYVGLPVAVGFAEKYPVTGYDINHKRIEALKLRKDTTGEVTTEQLNNTNLTFTIDEKALKPCNFIIVTVPTPISEANTPDLSHLQKASAIVGNQLTEGDIVVYESTVYPGVTEDICLPILEAHSNMKAGVDFDVGYSPERINPGDKEHTFSSIEKVVSAQNDEALKKIDDMYRSILKAPVTQAASIKVAEASKIVENTQRDINIALMNELFYMFHHMDINTCDVLKASRSKWNFLPFTPGLVGGHCIGVDPYYLIHKAKICGYESELMAAARKINDYMPTYLVNCIANQLIENNICPNDCHITVFGITFKENVPDLRNSKAVEMINQLTTLGLSVAIYDPLADREEAKDRYGLSLKLAEEIPPANMLILAVPHDEFLSMNTEDYLPFLKNNRDVIVFDIKNSLENKTFPDHVNVWTL
ncbi:nucleotide sugar dehydrogenase [Salipaludibacillus sp. LMS25]|uniref:nucleotide sugar dehydrogenase n=1 Tax=Salipaludibacillus sp. LMS25 TaxID=2924031 RepID=UPI0020D01968|nr:nucleotide sugar dehydrogenase [Salipaludibacillus sp. LMS25]UTR15330.1 nucleotide sugar dehydrogenase [Salipaludibacillus sp. LMS25]